MKVGAARAEAFNWVMRYASGDAGFIGAFFTGSTVRLKDSVELPDFTDVDLAVVTTRDAPPTRLGTFEYRGVLLEVGYLPAGRVESAGEVLASYDLAESLHRDSIILDPGGRLRQVHEQVANDFARHLWVRRRCEDALQRIERGLRSVHASAPLADQVGAWIGAVGLTAHVPIIAALGSPAGRLRYLAVQDVLDDYGHTEVYPELLNLLGCVHLSRRRVQHHLRTLAQTFDTTFEVARGEFYFGAPITPQARPIVIDGNEELIELGYHREAMFGIVAAFAHCHTLLAAEAPRSLRRELTGGFEAALTDLNVTSPHDLGQRVGDALRYLPRLARITEKILDANTAIETR